VNRRGHAAPTKALNKWHYNTTGEHFCSLATTYERKGGNSSTQEFVNELTVKGELPKGKP
jgi:hypothetical protein